MLLSELIQMISEAELFGCRGISIESRVHVARSVMKSSFIICTRGAIKAHVHEQYGRHSTFKVKEHSCTYQVI